MPTPYRYRSVWIMAFLAAALLLALATDVITLPGAKDTAHAAQSATRQNLEAARMAADKQWASATCTDILDWKNVIQRDATSLDPGLGPSARLRDAVNATTRMLGTLALPPSSEGGQANADAQRLRSEIEARVHAIQADATGAASGNLAAIGRLLADVSRDQAVGPQLKNELRHLISADLGLSLAETRACRAIVGIPN